MENALPYRQPWGGWNWYNLPMIGCGNSDFTRSVVPSYVNITSVADYHIPPDEPIGPYGRHGRYPPNGGDCPVENCTAGDELCDEWTTGSTTNGTFENTYTPAYGDATVNLSSSQCVPKGFKNIQAGKYWHGVRGFDDYDGCNSTWSVSPRNIKYRTANINYRELRYEYDSGEPSGSYPYIIYNWNRNYTVGRYTGVITINNATDTEVTGGGAWPWPSASAVVPSSNTTIVSSNCYEPDWITASIDLVNNWETFRNTFTPPVPFELGPTCQLTRSTEYPYSESYYRFIYTKAPYYYDQDAEQWFPEDREEYELTVTLSDPYTDQDLLDDIIYLQNQWSLANDILHPPRTDIYSSFAPVVTFKEVKSAVTPNQWQVASWVDTNSGSILYDGSVKGDPNPLGYQPEFDFEHTTYNVCTDNNFVTSWWQYRYGAKVYQNNYGDATDAVMPPYSTQWTENHIGDDYYPYSWLKFDATYQKLYGQCWIETLQEHNSLNYARPCGADRILFDEQSVGYVYDWSGNTIYYSQSVNPILINDYVGLRLEDELESGVYKVLSTGSNELTLGPKLLDYPYVVSDNLIVGKLRYWTTAHPICGRVEIISQSISASVLLIDTITPCEYLVDGDTVALFSGSTLIESSQISMSGNTIVCIDLSDIPTDPINYIQSMVGGATQSYWLHDDRPKGDYREVEWFYSNRNVAIDPTYHIELTSSGLNQNTVDIICNGTGSARSCFTNKVYIGGDATSYGGRQTFLYPSASAVVDINFNGFWQGKVEQYVADPFWEIPHKPLYALDYQWLEQNTCEADAHPVYYYSHRPMIEFGCSYPDGYTLSSYALVSPEIRSIEDIIDGTITNKMIAIPPSPAGEQHAMMLPYPIYGAWNIIETC